MITGLECRPCEKFKSFEGVSLIRQQTYDLRTNSELDQRPYIVKKENLLKFSDFFNDI